MAFPTETVYGLGADATNDRALARLYEAKGRPRFNPLIVHFANAAAAFAHVGPDARARRLAAAFWPGALTLVLGRRPDSALSLLVSAGLDSVAVRVPAHDVAQALIAAAGCPLAAPSANRSETVSPTTAAHVAQSLGGRIDMILDGGPCRVGVESTVVDLSGDAAALLRPGGVPTAEIEAVIGPLAEAAPGGPLKSPGQLARHYAPAAPLRINAGDARPGELLLGFGAGAAPGTAPGTAPGAALNLSPGGDLREAAANLFAMIRALDARNPAGIAVNPIPEQGLGQAINDRLRRAAHYP